jgi:hypothetical protein
VVQIFPTVTPQLLSPLGFAPAPALAQLLPDAASADLGGVTAVADGGAAAAVAGEGAAVAASTELLLCKDSSSFFVQADGKVRF